MVVNALIQAQYGRQTSRVKILMVGFLLLVFCDLRSLFSLLDISLRVKKQEASSFTADI